MSMVVKTFNVKDMECAHCMKTITNEVAQLDGIIGVDTNLRRKTCKVTYDSDEVTAGQVARTIINLGYSLKKQHVN